MYFPSLTISLYFNSLKYNYFFKQFLGKFQHPLPTPPQSNGHALSNIPPLMIPLNNDNNHHLGLTIFHAGCRQNYYLFEKRKQGRRVGVLFDGMATLRSISFSYDWLT